MAGRIQQPTEAIEDMIANSIRCPVEVDIDVCGPLNPLRLEKFGNNCHCQIPTGGDVRQTSEELDRLVVKPECECGSVCECGSKCE